MTPAELLLFLAKRGGQEYAAQLIRPQAASRKRRPAAAPLDLPLYRLTLRGDQVQASGPAGQVRLLSRAAFLEVFGAYHFTALVPTGELTDLGPLFGAARP